MLRVARERERRTPPVRYDETPSLSVCAFGAGAVHAAILALVLPVMITLPAPDDKAQGTVAIQVVVRSEPPPMLQPAMADAAVMPLPAFMGEGDIDQAGVPVVPHEEIASSLPEVPAAPDILPAYAAVSDALFPDQTPQTTGLAVLPLVENVPAPHVDAQAGTQDIASIDSQEAPDAREVLDARAPPVPPPLRKPAVGVSSKSALPRQHVATPQRSRVLRSPQARRIYKGLLGGRQATTMPEYPFAAR